MFNMVIVISDNLMIFFCTFQKDAKKLWDILSIYFMW